MVPTSAVAWQAGGHALFTRRSGRKEPAAKQSGPEMVNCLTPREADRETDREGDRETPSAKRKC